MAEADDLHPEQSLQRNASLVYKTLLLRSDSDGTLLNTTPWQALEPTRGVRGLE